MDKDIQAQIDRAKELFEELKESYNQDLRSQEVSYKSKNLTQEILFKMRSVLDQSLYKFFEKEITPNLANDEKKKARIYFPITSNRSSLKSTLGRGKMSDLEQSHPGVFEFIESIQPYVKTFDWMKKFTEFANEKHIRLTPQKKFVRERKTVSRPEVGKVSWTPQDVKFKSGVKIMGAPVDARTQDIVPTPGVESRREIWVSFILGDSGVNSLWLCETVINKVEKIIYAFFHLF